ncbi:MAG: ABC transporter ATP-binding protein, partial [Candidatus Latescibacteria bacterium]|nr:ABC transporter ATP-binding protein [Candidatus Latescibacterota bacterium]
MPETPAPYGPLAFLRRIGRRLRPHRWLVVMALVAVLVQVAFNLVLPLCYQAIFDRVIAGRDREFLFFLLAAMGVGFAAMTLAELIQGYLSARLGARVAGELRQQLFDHLQQLPLGFYSRQSSGDLVARFTADLGTVDTAVTTALYKITFHTLLLGTSVVLLFVVDWRLAVLTLLAFPLGVAGPKLLGSRTARAGYANREEQARLAGMVQENLQAQKVIRAFGLRAFFRARFAAQLEALCEGSVRVNLLSTFAGKSASVGVLLVQLLVLGAGAWLAIDGELTGGGLVGFVGLLINVGNSAKMLTTFIPDLVQAAASLQRVEELLAEPAEPPDAGVPLPRLSRELRFEQVSFRYGPDGPGLVDLNFVIPAGQSVAFVGRSGSGKSTVLNLLAGFYTPQQGA